MSATWIGRGRCGAAADEAASPGVPVCSRSGLGHGGSIAWCATSASIAVDLDRSPRSWLRTDARADLRRCVSNTGCRSLGEREMTLSTSAVAVCCSSACCSSRVRACTSSNSRAFSIAITAWSAKVVTSSICLSVNGRTGGAPGRSRRSAMPSRSSGTPSMVR